MGLNGCQRDCKKIECEINSELSIKNISIRFQLHEYVVNHNLLEFLSKFIDCHRSVTSTRKKLRGNNVARLCKCSSTFRTVWK